MTADRKCHLCEGRLRETMAASTSRLPTRTWFKCEKCEKEMSLPSYPWIGLVAVGAVYCVFGGKHSSDTGGVVIPSLFGPGLGVMLGLYVAFMIYQNMRSPTIS